MPLLKRKTRQSRTEPGDGTVPDVTESRDRPGSLSGDSWAQLWERADDLASDEAWKDFLSADIIQHPETAWLLKD